MLGRHEVQEVLVEVRAHHLPAPRHEPGLVQLGEERRETWRHDRVEDDIGSGRHDVGHHGLVVDVIEREVLLADDLAAPGGHDLADLLVQRVRPDVVGRGHVEGRGPRLLHQPGEERLDLLGRHRPGAEDERVALLALVLLRVQVELAGFVDHGHLDGLPGRAVDAADDDVDVGLDEPGRRGLRHVVIGGTVLDEQLDGTAEQTALRVDVVDDHPGHVDVGDAHEGQGAGLVGDDPDPSRTIDGAGHRRPYASY